MSAVKQAATLLTKRRPPGQGNPGAWKPGQSGNPKGRPPGVLARDLARQHTEVAITTLVKALDDKRLCVQAAIAILDRGWGKPKETLETAGVHVMLGGTDHPPIPETVDEWLERRRTVLARLDTETPKH